ncbi:OmpA family protein [Chitinivibrio alkaliphilus]|uniref:OmpA-like domain-containing protein n=1 Tax=Chitinivibrio alkaliphilus ACht1 TaxID=1313304 RepID=U7DAJ3_9BACT|nr:OmpA family protein [Chitinivibrio alkaliphilus]ERP32152.1 hypothetical protein CALK_0881 [Chitinivibrio alkaliphilus ACht1]
MPFVPGVHAPGNSFLEHVVQVSARDAERLTTDDPDASLSTVNGLLGLQYYFSPQVQAAVHLPYFADLLTFHNDQTAYFGPGDLCVTTYFSPMNTPSGASYGMHMGVGFPTGNSSSAVIPRYAGVKEASFTAGTIRLLPGFFGAADFSLLGKKALPLTAHALIRGDIPVDQEKEYSHLQVQTGLICDIPNHPFSFSLDLDVLLRSDYLVRSYRAGEYPAMVRTGMFIDTNERGGVLYASLDFGITKDRTVEMDAADPIVGEYSATSGLAFTLGYRHPFGQRYVDTTIATASHIDTEEFFTPIDMSETIRSLIIPEYFATPSDEAPSLRLEKVARETPLYYDKCVDTTENMELLVDFLFQNDPYNPPYGERYTQTMICPSDVRDSLGPIVLYGVTFGVGSTSISPTAAVHLDPLVDILGTYESLRVRIGGHTDASGNYDRNVELSRQRARAVHDYLVSQGISSERLSVEAYGPSKPIADNRSATGQQVNRRIEVLFYDDSILQ